MAVSRLPCFLVAGTHSGCGKTTVALGLMAALSRRGLRVAPGKCGPDFIDPGLHAVACGRASRNLDLAMCGGAWVRHLLAGAAASSDVVVIEGVMGLFDGGEGGTAGLARRFGLPVVLVVDVRASAESVVAVVHGFASLDPGVRVVAVLCNRVASARHRQLIERAMAGRGLPPVLGWLPRDGEVALPSRHLGLFTAEDHPLPPARIGRLAAWIEAHVDLDTLLSRCRTAVPAAVGPDPGAVAAPAAAAGPGVRIAVARDAAFCFYYQDNLDLLAAAGAELVPFSPLRDSRLPGDVAAVYLGGGYPELYAGDLAANQQMRRSLAAFCAAGGLVYGECGGFLYLCRELADGNGRVHPMTGVFPVQARMEGRRMALGYRRAELLAPCCLGPPGAVLAGHEFHYSAIGPMPATVERVFGLADGGREGYRVANTLAGYLHLHFGSRPEAAAAFVGAARGSAVRSPS